MRQLRKEGQQEPVLVELERRMQQRGQKKHFNEYSEFHARETEAHICASFMEMVEMKTINVMYTA